MIEWILIWFVVFVLFVYCILLLTNMSTLSRRISALEAEQAEFDEDWDALASDLKDVREQLDLGPYEERDPTPLADFKVSTKLPEDLTGFSIWGPDQERPDRPEYK